jgi:thioredoxin reductase (NADPH)
MEKLLIIGSGPAGFTAAIYAARANLNPLILSGLPLESSSNVLGGQLTTTTDVENYPGFKDGIMGPDLMVAMQQQAERFGTRVEQDHVTQIDLSKRPFKAKTANGKEIEAATVIITTGASAKYLGLESEKAFAGKGVSACATCDGFFYKDKDIVVVGGGDTAMEEATFLTNFGKSVTLLNRRDEFRASKIMLERARKNPKINIRTPFVVQEVLGDEKVTGVKIKNSKTGEEETIAAQGFFLAIGHKPNTAFLNGQLDANQVGYLKVDARTRVSKDGKIIEGVYAAGDVADDRYRQAVTAAGTGCAAALEAQRFLEEKGEAGN